MCNKNETINTSMIAMITLLVLNMVAASFNIMPISIGTILTLILGMSIVLVPVMTSKERGVGINA